MSAVYLIIGLYLLIFGWDVLNLLQNNGLGIILVIYGIFRAYRIYSSARESKIGLDEDKTENI